MIGTDKASYNRKWKIHNERVIGEREPESSEMRRSLCVHSPKDSYKQGFGRLLQSAILISPHSPSQEK
jgi:hypothetical protein